MSRPWKHRFRIGHPGSRSAPRPESTARRPSRAVSALLGAAMVAAVVGITPAVAGATDAVSATISVGSGPYGVAVGPDGTHAYVANNLSHSVSVIDTSTDTVTSTITVGSGPEGVAVGPAGTHVYVTNYGSSTVSVIDTSNNTVTKTITVGANPTGVAVGPNGTHVYVANETAGTVSVINTSTNKVTTPFTVGSDPTGVAVGPGGTHVYVANFDSNSVSVINTSTNKVTTPFTVGSHPTAVAVGPNGTHVYVTNTLSGTISVINTSTNKVTTPFTVGSAPTGVAVGPGGTRVYVANTNSGTVSVIDTSTNTVASPITVGSSPQGVAVGPNGTHVYVTNTVTNTVSGTVSVISPITAPSAPTGLTAKAGNAQVKLSWTAPSSNGGSKVTGYNVYEGTSTGKESPSAVNSSLITGTSYTAKSLTNGKTYYFTVKAVNTVGPSDASSQVSATPMAAVAPGTPTKVTLSGSTGELVTRWVAPTSDGGSPLAHYVVKTYKTDGGTAGTLVSTTTASASALGTPITKGTTFGDRYYVTVAAVNGAGLTSSTATSPVVTLTKPAGTTPSAVPYIIATNKPADTGHFGVQWGTPASDGGLPIEGYKVTVTPLTSSGAHPVATELVTQDPLLTLPNSVLDGATKFTVSVTPYNALGAGTAHSVTITRTSTLPGQVRGVSAVSGTKAGQIVVSWGQSPSTTDTEMYLVSAQRQCTGTCPKVILAYKIVAAPATSYTFTGTPGAKYAFEVTAANFAGTSSTPGTARAVAPLHNATSPVQIPLPNPPTHVVAVPATGGTGATISWAPAPTGGLPVTYKVYLSTSKTGVRSHSANATLSGHQVTVSGLRPATTYYLQIVASGPGGSVTSKLISFTTPSAPAKTHKKPVSTTHHWTWSLGSANKVVPGKGAPNLGSPATSHLNLNQPTVGLVADPADTGYWIFAKDGGVFAYGSAKFYGSVPGVLRSNQHLLGPITDLVVDRAKTGYWLVGSEGGVFAFGSAKFYGSLPGEKITPKSPITKLVEDTSGTGYWLVSATGQSHAFGSATGAVSSTTASS